MTRWYEHCIRCDKVMFFPRLWAKIRKIHLTMRGKAVCCDDCLDSYLEGY